MHSDDTGRRTQSVRTEQEAIAVLLDRQEREGGVRTIPAGADTVETEPGWAFFNANGYLGTVTPEGEVIEEEQFASEE